MKTISLGAAAWIAFATSAFAADLPRQSYTKAPTIGAPQPIYDWTGFHVGGHVGGAFNDNNSLIGRGGGRLFGGAEVGVDRQFAPGWVLGTEVQFEGLIGNGRGALFPGNTLVTGNNNILASVTGRAGYAWGPVLLYGKLGAAFRDDNDIKVTTGGAPIAVVTSGHHEPGITAGAGLEYMFAPKWSAKAEYQYYTFGDTTVTTGPAAIVGTRFRDDTHTVKLGINYRWGS